MPEWKEIVTLEKSNPAIEYFGIPCQVSGNHLIVSDGSNVYIYERITKGNKWELKYTHTNISEDGTSAVSISGKNAIASNVTDTNPSVYFYQKNNKGNWEIYQTLDPVTEEWGGVFYKRKLCSDCYAEPDS